MGSYTNGVYVPAISEPGGWGEEVNDFLTRSGEEHINVKAAPYGAKGDGVTDDTAAIQAAVDTIGTNGGTLLFPPGTYKVSSPGIVLPGGTNGVEYHFRILGYGATITAATAISMMTRANPAQYSPGAVQMTNARFRIEGLRFQGNGTSGQIGLDMVACYGLEVLHCAAVECDTGFRFTFCLMTNVQSCFAQASRSYGFVARSGSGVFTDGTVSNSGCNHTTFTQCHDSAYSGQLAQFYVRASSNVSINDCITEGGNPARSIDFQAGSSSVKSFGVNNLHHETSPTDCIIKCVMDVGGTAIFDKIWVQSPNQTIIDAFGGISNTIVVRNIPWMPSGSKFRHDDDSPYGQQWVFGECGVGQDAGTNTNLTDAAYWVDGIVPYYMHVERQLAFGHNPASLTQPFNGVQVYEGHVYILSGLNGDQLPSNWYHAFFNNNARYDQTSAADANPVFRIEQGVVSFGAGGASAVDTNLYRSAANVLKTDDKLVTALGLGVGNSAAATTPGSVVKKMEVFDASGNSLGYIPIYNAIT